MIRVTRRAFFIISICVITSAQFLYAQDSSGLEEQGEYDLIVDEALDRVEVNIDQISNDTAAVEAEMLEGAKTETKMGILAEVEVLEEIVVADNNGSQEILETKIIPLLHAEASGIVDILNGMKNPTGEVLYNEEDRTLTLKDAPKQLEAMSAYVKEVDILLETEVFKLQHVQAQDVIEKIRGILTKNVGQVQFDQRADSIIATDTPLKIGEIKDLISGLDFFNKEVWIETKILQIILNDEHMMGVDWEAIVSDFQNIDFIGFASETDLTGERTLKIGAVSQEDYEILLEALDTVGVVNNVSDDVLKMKNKSAKTINILSLLSRGAKEPGSSSGDNDDDDQGGIVQFHLTPTIDRDNLVTVAIEPEHVDNSTGKSTRAPDTKAMIQIENGETIVIGSLFEEVTVESTWKIPLLGDLPFLGFVFRNQGEISRKAEIITFLTVKIVEKIE